MQSSDNQSGNAPIRVLVVDDDNELCQLYTASLEIRGCHVQSVNSGRQALQVLMNQVFDVLVVDLRMEEMDGLTFLQEALRIWPFLGVVVASAYLTEEAVQKARRLGVTRVVAKSTDLQHLFSQIADEAREKHRVPSGLPSDHSVDLMRNHLRLLNRLAERSTSPESLEAALCAFGQSLAEMLTTDLIGMLVVQRNETVMLLIARAPLHPDFLRAAQQEMQTRFEALSGRRLDLTTLREKTEGTAPAPDGLRAVGSFLSVPIMLDNDVCGLLTLASALPVGYSAPDVSILYHAANHVSAAFMALRRMQQLAALDSLTGVFNRIRLEEELERAWLFSRRYGFSMAVAIIDIDNFKTLNDSYDHSVGDQILIEFVQVLRQVERSSDIVARYGGDEFVVILPRADELDAAAFAKRLLRATREHQFLQRTYRLNLTISIGVATSMNSTAPSTGAELLSQADRALYTAKRSGRDRVAFWPGHTRTEQARAAEDDATPAEAPAEVHRGRIAVVDDEPLILGVVARMLQEDRFEVTLFNNATEAIAAIQSKPNHFDVVLTDLMMPQKSGLDLLREIGQADSLAVKIVMTGYATVDNAISCLREDTYDFIQKPFRKKELVALVNRAMEYRRLREENARYQQHLEQMVRERNAQVATTLEEVKRSYEFTLEALVAMLDARENYTARHSQHVRELAVALGRAAGISKEELQSLAYGALLHDIGKIGIPDAVLNRPSALSAEEWKVMRTHPAIGYDIIHASPYLRDAAEIVLSHHERFDGTGYPRGLRGAEICRGARIFSIVDAYDAMRSERVYRRSLPAEKAVEDIRRHAGTQFDPALVEVFLRCQPELERIWSASDGSSDRNGSALTRTAADSMVNSLTLRQAVRRSAEARVVVRGRASTHGL